MLHARSCRLFALALVPGLAFGATRAAALEELKGEKRAISACELQLCTMLVVKERKGADLACTLTKTWGRKTIKDAETTTLSWGFGDARCTVKLAVKRAEIVEAITAPKAKFHLARQQIHCIVEEGGSPKDVHVVVSPKVEFKDGKAVKLWINLDSVDGPGGVTSLLNLGAKLHDSLGLFHSALLKSINGFIDKSCPKVYAKAKEDEARRAKLARAAKKLEAAPAQKSEPAEAQTPDSSKQATSKQETPKAETPKVESGATASSQAGEAQQPGQAAAP